MSWKPLTTLLTGGFNQALQRHLLNIRGYYDSISVEKHFWDGLNLRPNKGRLEQTKWVGLYTALTHLTGETVDTPVRLLKFCKTVAGNLRWLVINQTNARFIDPSNLAVQVPLPCVLQIVIPNNTSITGECLLFGINVTDFAATNDQIDVVIEAGGLTFKWRRNGGTYVTGVGIGGAVALGINGLKVSFQQITPFTYTPGDTWSWKRQTNIPYTGADSTTFNYAWSSSIYNRDIYIGGIERQVMRVRDDFITSVGYKRVYGKYVKIFNNHLIVGQYAAGMYDSALGVVDGFNKTITPFTIGWSHLNNPDQMFATPVNEADQYPIPEQTDFDGADLGITGMEEWNGILYIGLSSSMSTMTYQGRPVVMQILPFSPIGCKFQAGMVKGKLGIYFISASGFYRLTGGAPENIGMRVVDKFYSDLCPQTDANYQRLFSYYDVQKHEVVWVYWTLKATGQYQLRAVCYDELHDKWYFRNMPSDAGPSNVTYCGTTFSFDQSQKCLYGMNGLLGIDLDYSSTATPYTDFWISDGVYGYTEPFIETGFDSYDQIYTTKESEDMFIDAALVAGRGLKLGIGVAKTIADGSVSFVDESQVWTSDLREVKMSSPRIAFRQIAYRFKFVAHAASFVRGAIFNGYQENIKGINEGIER